MSAAHARQLPIQSAHGLPSSPSPTPVLPPECTYLTLILLLRGHSTPIPHPTLITHSSTPRPMILPEKSLSLSAIPNGAPDSLMAASPTSLRGAHHATPPPSLLSLTFCDLYRCNHFYIQGVFIFHYGLSLAAPLLRCGGV
ncbi:hypothetical protein CCMSSC00406_0010181 [Pleurotus cornucopiae]|uniref:Uncharacterized protein n=1 Tax=Pleurotus cornucopiae TaxID=5321 RepID=A0ACB7IQB8_PLECO|nr:hypothetical protein CCMSSC00406_0010181 [Pleurotus cornucopiae]